MTTAENSKKPYLLEVLRGEQRLDPLRLIGYIAERIGQKIQSGIIFRRKPTHYD
jgi:hypothetical protein